MQLLLATFGMSQSKGLTQNKKKKLCIILDYQPPQPIYLLS
jgi:hypothetical protein